MYRVVLSLAVTLLVVCVAAFITGDWIAFKHAFGTCLLILWHVWFFGWIAKRMND